MNTHYRKVIMQSSQKVIISAILSAEYQYLSIPPSKISLFQHSSQQNMTISTFLPAEYHYFPGILTAFIFSCSFTLFSSSFEASSRDVINTASSCSFSLSLVFFISSYSLFDCLKRYEDHINVYSYFSCRSHILLPTCI